MAITPFIEIEGDDAAHAMGKERFWQGFPGAGKGNPRAGLHGGLEGRSRASGACLPDKHSQQDCPERQIAMTCAANQSYVATTARVVHIKRRISSLKFELRK